MPPAPLQRPGGVADTDVPVPTTAKLQPPSGGVSVAVGGPAGGVLSEGGPTMTTTPTTVSVELAERVDRYCAGRRVDSDADRTVRHLLDEIAATGPDAARLAMDLSDAIGELLVVAEDRAVVAHGRQIMDVIAGTGWVAPGGSVPRTDIVESAFGF